MCTHEQTDKKSLLLQGGQDSWDPSSCTSFSKKEPLNKGHFYGKYSIKIRDSMSLRHPVAARLNFIISSLATIRMAPINERLLSIFNVELVVKRIVCVPSHS